LEKNKNGLIIIGLFVGVILAILFTQIIANNVFETGTTRNEINHSYTFASASTQINNKAIRGLGNVMTDTILVNNFTNNSIASNNYLAYTNGSIILRAGASGINGQGTAPILNVSHSYYSENYVRDSTSRTFLTLITLFFAIGLLIYLVIYLRNNTGLFDSF
jgi:hypothetical protein